MEYSEVIEFDAGGNGTIRKSVPSLPVSVEAEAWLSGLDAVFDVYLISPQKDEWHGLRENQRIRKKLRLKLGSTVIEAKVSCGVPNARAQFHIAV